MRCYTSAKNRSDAQAPQCITQTISAFVQQLRFTLKKMKLFGKAPQWGYNEDGLF